MIPFQSPNKVIHNKLLNANAVRKNRVLPVTSTFWIVCLSGKSRHLEIIGSLFLSIREPRHWNQKGLSLKIISTTYWLFEFEKTV